jgi:hypothetical protein
MNLQNGSDVHLPSISPGSANSFISDKVRMLSASPVLLTSLSSQFSLSPDPTQWGAAVSMNHPEPDDVLHNPDPKRDRRSDGGGSLFTHRGLANLGCLLLISLAVIALLYVTLQTLDASLSMRQWRIVPDTRSLPISRAKHSPTVADSTLVVRTEPGRYAFRMTCPDQTVTSNRFRVCPGTGLLSTWRRPRRLIPNRHIGMEPICNSSSATSSILKDGPSIPVRLMYQLGYCNC